MRISANTTLSAGRWKLIDVYTGGVNFTINSIIMSSTQSNPNWEIYIDKDVNNLIQPAQPSLVATTTGGSLPRSTQLFVVITTIDTNGIEGPPSDAYKTITTGGSTDTSKITVTFPTVVGAVSYNVYAGTAAGSEGFIGNSVSSFIITTMPTNANLSVFSATPPTIGTGCSTTPDFYVYGHRDGSESISLANGYPLSYRLVVYVSFTATGQPSFSALLG